RGWQMNTNCVSRHYDALKPEERFRLILAASGRNDEAERDRLVNAASRITLSFRNHWPYSQAFDELALWVYIELLAEAAHYYHSLAHADDAREILADDEENESNEPRKNRTRNRKQNRGKRPVWMRSLDLALAAGYVLRAKADGWKLFCE